MANDIMSTLATMGRGQAIDSVNDEFRKVVDDVIAYGGSGELTLKIKIKAAGHDRHSGHLTEVAVTHNVSTKRPKKDMGSSTFFVTRAGQLTRNDPAQQEMFEQEIADSIKTTAEPKKETK